MASNIQGHGAPTKKTPGVIGQSYTDLDTKQVWVCADVKHTMDPASLKMISQYEWDVQQTTDDNSSAFGKFKNPKPVLFEGTITLQELTTVNGGAKMVGFFLPADFQLAPYKDILLNVYVDDNEYSNLVVMISTEDNSNIYDLFIPNFINIECAVTQASYFTESATIGQDSTYVMTFETHSVGQSVHVKIMDSREFIIAPIDVDLLPENLGYPAEAKHSWILGDKSTDGLSKMGMQQSFMIGSSIYENMSNDYESGSGSCNLISGCGNGLAPEAKNLTQSIIFGNGHKISGSVMFALGAALKGCNSYQTILGKYNALDPKYGTYYKDGQNILMVGNGTSDTARSNAMTLDWSGNAEFQGDVKANACGGETPISLVETWNEVQTKITAPSDRLAQVGYALTVGGIDANGNPTRWSTIQPNCVACSRWSSLAECITNGAYLVTIDGANRITSDPIPAEAYPLIVQNHSFSRGTSVLRIYGANGSVYTAALNYSSGTISTPTRVYNDSMYIKSSTAGSSKVFKITVDDTGALAATEVTE